MGRFFSYPTRSFSCKLADGVCDGLSQTELTEEVLVLRRGGVCSASWWTQIRHRRGLRRLAFDTYWYLGGGGDAQNACVTVSQHPTGIPRERVTPSVTPPDTLYCLNTRRTSRPQDTVIHGHKIFFNSSGQLRVG